MPVAVDTLTDPASFAKPCEVGRGVFLPFGDRGPCPNRRMLLVSIPGADRVAELCSDHAQAVQEWW
jgi:hypothetical protein